VSILFQNLINRNHHLLLFIPWSGDGNWNQLKYFFHWIHQTVNIVTAKKALVFLTTDEDKSLVDTQDTRNYFKHIFWYDQSGNLDEYEMLNIILRKIIYS
jgi:hypothetical protein